MRKLHPEEYRCEWNHNQKQLEKDLHNCMKILSLPETDFHVALKRVLNDLRYQSITDMHGITITATVETVLVDTLTANAELVHHTYPLYHYHIQYSFFKLLRNHAGMTFNEMAAMLHVPKTTYMQWEKENYTPETWVQKLVMEKYQLETFKRKMGGKIPILSAFSNIICTKEHP